MFWCLQVLIAIDQLVNAILGGWADESLSSRAWRLSINKGYVLPYKLIDVLFFWDTNHCYNSFVSERMGRQLPPELRR